MFKVTWIKTINDKLMISLFLHILLVLTITLNYNIKHLIGATLLWNASHNHDRPYHQDLLVIALFISKPHTLGENVQIEIAFHGILFFS